MARVVKRYANRKLYDTATSRYVALDDIATLVRSGEDVEVTDNESGADLTAVTFAQIILEEERRTNFLSIPVLRELVRYGSDAIAGVSRGIEALGEIRERANRRVSEIVGEKPVGPTIVGEVFNESRRRIDALQRRVDEGLKQSVERLRSYPGIGSELERLEGRIRSIEGQIKRLIVGHNGEERLPADEPANPADLPTNHRA
jgi:polyhydroxyalkanoate synthesis repressor PhaR